MRSQVAPDPYPFAKQLKAIVANESKYAQALAFRVGERYFRLRRETMAAMAGRDVHYVTDVLHLTQAEGLLIEGLADLTLPTA